MTEDETEGPLEDAKTKESQRLSRLQQKRLATSLADSSTSDTVDDVTTRKRLRSSTEPPKIIMRISKGKVTDQSPASGDDEGESRKRRSRKDGEEEQEEGDTKKIKLMTERRSRGRSKSRSLSTGDRSAGSCSKDAEIQAKAKKESKSVDGLSLDGSEPDVSGFCWTCHKAEAFVTCATCPRKFHTRCVVRSPQKLCPECSAVIHADSENRGDTTKRLKLDQLCSLLSFTLDRMKNVADSEPFCKAVDPADEPMYYSYINNPMDLSLLGENIKKRLYGSTVAFLGDAKWILHNSIVFNSTQSPLTTAARAILKVCRQELEEIDKCPDCYLNAHTKEDWFIQVCKKPHVLLWARLKGFPFWPAKALAINSKTQMVDARFFGAHDKAWVPVRDCFLLSKNSPPSGCKGKGADLDGAFIEMRQHIDKIRAKLGSFIYAADKVPYVPDINDQQLAAMIPGWVPPEKFGKLISRKSAEVERLSAEDQVVRDLERMADGCAVLREIVDDTSTDCDEVMGEGRTPEHGYSLNNDTTEMNGEDSAPKPTPDSCSPMKEDTSRTEANTPLKLIAANGETVDDAAKEAEDEKEVRNLEEKKELVKTPTVEEDKSEKELEKKTTDADEKKLGKATLVRRSSLKDADLDEEPAEMNALKEASKNPLKKRRKSLVNDLVGTSPEPNDTAATPTIATSATATLVTDKPVTDTAPDSTSSSDFVQVEVKQENFDQYLDEENQHGTDDPTLSKEPEQDMRQPMLMLTDIGRLGMRPQRTASSEAKKAKAKAPAPDGKLRLTDEVSLVVVGGEKADQAVAGPAGVPASNAPKPRKSANKARKTIPRAQGRLENSVTISTCSSDVTMKGPARSVNVISVDTRHSDAQRSLLKSLCLEEKRSKKSAPVVASAPGATTTSKKTTIKDGNIMCPPKNMVVTSSSSLPSNFTGPILISQNGQTFIANPQNQNLALNQNNLLVQLTNLNSGIHHTNLVNLSNDGNALQSPFPTLYASGAPPPLSPFTTATGGILLAPSTSSAAGVGNGEKRGVYCRPFTSLQATPSSSSTASSSLASPPALSVIPPPAAAPADSIRAEVQRFSAKISEKVEEALESLLRGISENAVPEDRLRLINAERSHQHQQNFADLKKSYEQKLKEMKDQCRAEKEIALHALRSEMEHQIEEAKKKQWCAFCRKEALFYCCWNTSYCDYPCQQQHWPGHMSACAQVAHNAVTMANSAPPPTRRTGNAFVIRQSDQNRVQTSPLTLNPFQGTAPGVATYPGPGSKKPSKPLRD